MKSVQRDLFKANYIHLHSFRKATRLIWKGRVSLSARGYGQSESLL